MKYNSKSVVVLALSQLKGIGPAFIKKVTGLGVSSSNAYEELRRIITENSKLFEDEILFRATEYAEEIITKCNDDGITIISLNNQDYPATLKELRDPPPVLFCKGNLDLLYSKTVCIIGTREPNQRGIKIAERVGSFFANSNWTICNGLAAGIDSYSVKIEQSFHRNVIGVMAGGLNYNSQRTLLKNTALNADKVIENGGLIVSEIVPDKKEDTFTVVKSCRIQAGLSNGLVLVQSSLDGGSKFTTKAFCEISRPIGVINPVGEDYHLSSYEANTAIIEGYKKGLSRFTELKEDKIITSRVFTIKTKDDYAELESLLSKSYGSLHRDNSLFG
ncbi:DNA-processing protein DprA [Fibrisoma montanum]|uniref:DNA-processing protein DprA n=1 Tax=Fibrisoma montanum TaxID=2305895 RepID=UPI00131478A3|nr:DNA-processing protein DprA [Fibrisoma montanum]